MAKTWWPTRLPTLFLQIVLQRNISQNCISACGTMAVLFLQIVLQHIPQNRSIACGTMNGGCPAFTDCIATHNTFHKIAVMHVERWRSCTLWLTTLSIASLVRSKAAVVFSSVQKQLRHFVACSAMMCLHYYGVQCTVVYKLLLCPTVYKSSCGILWPALL